jgi:hypothetical protein
MSIFFSLDIIYITSEEKCCGKKKTRGRSRMNKGWARIREAEVEDRRGAIKKNSGMRGETNKVRPALSPSSPHAIP